MVSLVKSFHGGAPPVDKLPEVDLVALRFYVVRNFIGLLICFLEYFSCSSCLVQDVSGQGGSLHITFDLGLESFVVCYAVGDEVSLD